MVIYGKAPDDLGLINLDPVEMMCYLYLPIKMPDYDIRVPRRLEYLAPLLPRIVENAASRVNIGEHYIYLTAKTLFVHGSYSGNRPGWHADGFGSGGDLNYVWYNMNPTEFAVQEFSNIPTDDFESMAEMERQIDESKIVRYPTGHLLALDESVVHRVNPNIEAGMRTFIKVSVSRHQFNLAGNSHNYLFDYNWTMHSREETRNLDSNNKDFKL